MSYRPDLVRFPPCSLLVLGLILAPLSGCSGPGDSDDDDGTPGNDVDPLSWDLHESGPHNVGYTSWPLTYPGAGDGEDRTISIHIWYPTEATSGAPATYEFIFTDENSWVDAPPAAPSHDGGYPVLAYSHGSQGFPGSSNFLSRHFASHGWVVVAPEHIGNTLSTHSSPLPLDFYLDRPGDLSAALDSLEAGDSPLSAPIATDRVLAAGHSFGCHTMWASGGATYDAAAIAERCDAGAYPTEQCSDGVLDAFAAGMKDDRIVASVPMAGGGSPDWFGQDGLLSTDTPMLYMSGTDDPGAVDDVWDRSVGLEMSWLVIEGGCHQLFGLGSCGLISDEIGFGIVQSYALALGRQVILGDSDPGTTELLDGSLELDPAAVLTVR